MSLPRLRKFALRASVVLAMCSSVPAFAGVPEDMKLLIEQRQAAFETHEAQASEVLAQRLAALDDALAQRRARRSSG